MSIWGPFLSICSNLVHPRSDSGWSEPPRLDFGRRTSDSYVIPYEIQKHKRFMFTLCLPQPNVTWPLYCYFFDAQYSFASLQCFKIRGTNVETVEIVRNLNNILPGGKSKEELCTRNLRTETLSLMRLSSHCSK